MFASRYLILSLPQPSLCLCCWFLALVKNFPQSSVGCHLAHVRLFHRRRVSLPVLLLFDCLPGGEGTCGDLSWFSEDRVSDARTGIMKVPMWRSSKDLSLNRVQQWVFVVQFIEVAVIALTEKRSLWCLLIQTQGDHQGPDGEVCKSVQSSFLRDTAALLRIHRDNTSGTPPRDSAKMVRTTIHRVSVGVLRIKLWHLVYCLVWVPSKT